MMCSLISAMINIYIYISNTERGNEINYMDFDIDGLTFATCGKDLAVRIYDAKINKVS